METENVTGSEFTDGRKTAAEQILESEYDNKS